MFQIIILRFAISNVSKSILHIYLLYVRETTRIFT